ncbi:nucleotide-binding protein [Acidobacteria bacterium AH-259-D05]|nr:nucleotide-binding protein [Acidobacteria bacterium AH-259-D05]
MSINNRKMSAAARAVKHALSERRAEFRTRISEIEGEANARGGGVASLSSGTFVGQFVDAIETELRSRTQVARKALGNAVDSQKLNLRPEIVEQVKEAIRKVWSEETEDLREWYQKRVKSANKGIAEEPPFEPIAEAAFQGVFVDIENRALGGDARKVFVVHGRNEELRRAMFSFLRSLDLDPIEWTHAIALTGSGSPYVGDVLDAAFEEAQAVVVLMTPDDEARLNRSLLKPKDDQYERELTGQARPNVLFESGLAFGRSPDRTILVEVGNLRPFSDIGGRHTVRLTNDTQKRQELAERLKTAGCKVDLSGTDWHTEGDFELKYENEVTTESRSRKEVEDKKITQETLTSYLAEAFPDRESAPEEVLLELLVDLQTARYSTISEVNADLEKAELAFKRYERDRPPKSGRFADVGLVRVSLSIVNEFFLTIREETEASSHRYRKYRKFIKPE